MRGKRSTNRSIGNVASSVRTQSRFSRAVTRARSLASGNRDYVEELAVGSELGLLRLSQRRRWLLSAVVLGLIATVFVWLAVIRFPFGASAVLFGGFDSNLRSRNVSLQTVLVGAIPFVPPFISAFALGHLLFPSPPEPEIASGMMATFDYRQKSNKRYLIVIAAGMVGAVNSILIIIAITSLTGH
jgi:hypothetical protein